MNVFGEHCHRDYLNAGALASAQRNQFGIIGNARVDTADTPPGVPGDMRVHLEGTML